MSEEKVHTHVFTSESVSEGHPDKVADQISDAILDACLRRDPQAHVACETAVGPDIVINLGEIACQGFEGIDTEAIARRVVKRIGYTVPDEHFAAQTFKYENFLHGQSPDIAQGVNRKSRQKQGAGTGHKKNHPQTQSHVGRPVGPNLKQHRKTEHRAQEPHSHQKIPVIPDINILQFFPKFHNTY